jgi:uncharacterized protein
VAASEVSHKASAIMLIEFRVSNHRSIREEQILTMEAGRIHDDRLASVPRLIPGYNQPLLPAAAIYGANASGKSNLLNALFTMSRSILGSLFRDNDGSMTNDQSQSSGIAYRPFAWDGAQTEDSLYEVMFVSAGVRYQYGFAINGSKVKEEWLHAWPGSRKQVWLRREGQEFKFSPSMKPSMTLVGEATRPEVLLLSTAAFLNRPQLSPILNWFSGLNFGITSGRGGSSFGSLMRLLPDIEMGSQTKDHLRTEAPNSGDILKDRLKRMMKFADVGIGDMNVSTQKTETGSYRIKVEFNHAAGGESNAWLPLHVESTGTQNLFHAAFSFVDALDNGSIVVFDELDASLHPLIARRIVQEFNSSETNPKNAQLIFTTHDTNLLGNTPNDSPLRRDQVWLTEKTAKGATTLTPLTDYQPRKEESLERGYLQGRFGGVPVLSQFEPFLSGGS